MEHVQPVRQNPYPQVTIRRMSKLSVRCRPVSLWEGWVLRDRANDPDVVQRDAPGHVDCPRSGAQLLL